MAGVSSRAGRHVRQPAGFHACIPAPLPPDPPVDLDGPMLALLSRADQAIGLLDEISGRQRNRVYRYTPYWRVFQNDVVDTVPSIPRDATVS